MSAEWLSDDVERAVRLLLEENLCVSTTPMRGAEQLQRQLRRESGAVLRLLAPDFLEAETLLDFADSGLMGQALTLRMGKAELPRFLLPHPWEEIFPPFTHSGQLSAALWELGKVKAEKIGLKSRM